MLALLIFVQLVAADYSVIGTFIFGRHNDRTPKPSKVLTPIGAQGQYSAGQFYRARYFGLDSSNEKISDSNTTIVGANAKGLYKPAANYFFADSSNVIYYSHMAFLQGLFPPVELSGKDANASLAYLSNGSLIENPFDGYQYVQSHIQENATADYIWTHGDENCPALSDAADFVASNNSEYLQWKQESASFYAQLYSENKFLQETFNKSKMTFDSAMSIFDEVWVNTIHNETVAAQFNQSTIDRIQLYSDKYQWLISNNNVNSNLTIGAKTLMGAILKRLNTTKTQGAPLINYYTGSFSTMFQLASVMGLDTANSSFMTMPDYGSTYVFDLLNETSTNDTYVRFSFRNGTYDDDVLLTYPIFNQSSDLISWDDFKTNMEKYAITSDKTWCNSCGYFDEDFSGEMLDMCVPESDLYSSAEELDNKGINLAQILKGDYSSLKLSSGSKSGLTLAGAGGIGAAVTIGVFLLAGALFFVARKLMRNKKSSDASAASTKASSGGSSSMEQV